MTLERCVMVGGGGVTTVRKEILHTVPFVD